MDPKIEKRIKILEDNTNQIIDLLKSKPHFGQKGLVETVEESAEKIRMIELANKVQQARMGTIAGAISVFVSITGFVIQQWVKTK